MSSDTLFSVLVQSATKPLGGGNPPPPPEDEGWNIIIAEAGSVVGSSSVQCTNVGPGFDLQSWRTLCIWFPVHTYFRGFFYI